MSEFNDVTCPTCGHTYGYHAWQEMQQQREEMETARHIRDFAKLTREVHKRQQAEMPEPSIDDLLKWLDQVKGYDNDVESEAIRTILEHHEKLCDTAERIKLQAIQSFVGRAEKKAHATAKPHYWCEAFAKAIADELVALEKEAKTCQEELNQQPVTRQ